MGVSIRQVMAGVLLLAAGLPAQAASSRFQDLQVEVIGQGRQVLMIPGLNSGMDSWRDTCLALQDIPLQGHLVQLPGFAGSAPLAGPVDAFLGPVGQQLQAYIREEMAPQPVIAGHSLGGNLGLRLALDQPDLVGPLLIVDSLPFLPAGGNPAATPATTTPMATAMRAQMLALDAASYQQQAQSALVGMTKDAKRLDLLKQWGQQSDRATTAQAMYELMTDDLRPELARVRTPVRVLGAWEGYKPFGATEASTRQIFADQYASLHGVELAMAPEGLHFLMWDSPQWVEQQIRGLISAHP
jgi:pimeloyl-ACP methyl ester carboxylesterase